jgi:carbonic anhydrase/acetyltransferase-like protein (isoleucine patch superfamily)
VLDGAKVGSRALIAAGATVTPGMEIPDGMQAAGVPARRHAASVLPHPSP